MPGKYALDSGDNEKKKKETSNIIKTFSTFHRIVCHVGNLNSEVFHVTENWEFRCDGLISRQLKINRKHPWACHTYVVNGMRQFAESKSERILRKMKYLVLRSS